MERGPRFIVVDAIFGEFVSVRRCHDGGCGVEVPMEPTPHSAIDIVWVVEKWSVI